MSPRHVVTILLIILPTVAVAGAPKVSPQANTPVSILGSFAGIKTIGQLVRDYEGDRESHFIKFSPRDSKQVPEALKKHECDVGLVLDSLAAGGKDFQYEAFPIGRFVVHVAVNAKTPVHAMTLEELREVFRGKVTLWKDASSAAGRIELYAPLPTAPESSVFQKKVMRGAPFAKELRDRSASPRRQMLSAAEVIGAIAKQSNSIGFFLHDPGEPLDKRVRVLRIAGDNDSEAVPPSVAAVADGSYPLADTFTLYLHPDAPPEARAFCEFASGPKAAKIARQFGIWPEYELEQVRGQQRLADAKAGKGTRPGCTFGGPRGLWRRVVRSSWSPSCATWQPRTAPRSSVPRLGGCSSPSLDGIWPTQSSCGNRSWSSLRPVPGATAGLSSSAYLAWDAGLRASIEQARAWSRISLYSVLFSDQLATFVFLLRHVHRMLYPYGCPCWAS